eukprot:scaffold1402_cov254-Pinguiococcus_pyrenoidosus.AAC.24
MQRLDVHAHQRAALGGAVLDSGETLNKRLHARLAELVPQLAFPRWGDASACVLLRHQEAVPGETDQEGHRRELGQSKHKRERFAPECTSASPVQYAASADHLLNVAIRAFLELLHIPGQPYKATLVNKQLSSTTANGSTCKAKLAPPHTFNMSSDGASGKARPGGLTIDEQLQLRGGVPSFFHESSRFLELLLAK